MINIPEKEGDENQPPQVNKHVFCANMISTLDCWTHKSYMQALNPEKQLLLLQHVASTSCYFGLVLWLWQRRPWSEEVILGHTGRYWANMDHKSETHSGLHVSSRLELKSMFRDGKGTKKDEQGRYKLTSWSRHSTSSLKSFTWLYTHWCDITRPLVWAMFVLWVCSKWSQGDVSTLRGNQPGWLWQAGKALKWCM